MVSHGHQEPTATSEVPVGKAQCGCCPLIAHWWTPAHITPALPSQIPKVAAAQEQGSQKDKERDGKGNQKVMCVPLTGFCPSKVSPAFTQPSHHLICYLSLFLPSQGKLNLTKMLSIFSSPYPLALSKPCSVSLWHYCSLKNHFLQPFFLILLILPNTLLLNYTNIFIQ